MSAAQDKMRSRIMALASRKIADLDKELKEVGCPYSSNDHRSLVWIEGFRAGISDGEKIARELFR